MEETNKEKNKIRVFWTFHPFGLSREAVLPNGSQNCSSSLNESTPPVKPQLNLFWLEPELYQTGPKFW
jgi:hypothetical protein